MYFQGLSQSQHLLDVGWVDISLDGGKAGWKKGEREARKEGKGGAGWLNAVCHCFTGSVFVENVGSRDEPLSGNPEPREGCWSGWRQAPQVFRGLLPLGLVVVAQILSHVQFFVTISQSLFNSCPLGR